jgi:ribokinase
LSDLLTGARRCDVPSGDGGRILATGSILVDLTLSVPHLPPVGGDVIAGPPVLQVGGGFNLICAARRQGVPVAYAGRHGTGPYGDLVRSMLNGLGVPAIQPPAVEGDTGLCITFVDSAAERSFVTSPGVEAVVADEQLAGLDVRAADLVALSGYDLVYPGSRTALAAWVEASPAARTVLLDPGPLVLDIPTEVWAAVLPRTTVLTVNDREAAQLAGGDPAWPGDDPAVHAQIRERQRMSDDALLVVRHGPRGCSYTENAGAASVSVPSIAVRAVDTTGAGDTHAGVLLAELFRGSGPYDALLRANVAAAISVTRSGPATAPTRSEVDQRLMAER